MAVDETLRRSAAVAPGDEAPVGELIREALGDTRELVRLEVALAREDLRSELSATKAGAVGMSVAAAALVAGVTMLLVALVIALGWGWVGALVVGAALLVLAGASALLGYGAIPKHFFGRTTTRLRADVEQLRERIA
jgi:hypothetical protein